MRYKHQAPSSARLSRLQPNRRHPHVESSICDKSLNSNSSRFAESPKLGQDVKFINEVI